MNPDPHKKDDDPLDAAQEPTFDASLDELIRQALRADSASKGDELQLARLEAYWRSRRTRQRVWRRVGWGVSTAAAVLLLAIVPIGEPVPEELVARAEEQETEPSNPSTLKPTAATKTASGQREPAETPLSRNTVSAGRPPTDYERWMFAVQTRTQVVPTRPTLTLPEVIARVLMGAPVTLLERFERREVIEELLIHVSAEANREQALKTLRGMVGYAGWPSLVHDTNDVATREVLVQHLLRDRSEPALVAFLRLVHDDAMRDDVLTAASQLRDLPIAQLVALLDHDDNTIRLATSLALGRVNRCEMTEALITRVRQRPSQSKEAWFALFGCRCDAAADFLYLASQSPKLLGQLNNARVQWGRVFP